MNINFSILTCLPICIAFHKLFKRILDYLFNRSNRDETFYEMQAEINRLKNEQKRLELESEKQKFSKENEYQKSNSDSKTFYQFLLKILSRLHYRVCLNFNI